MSPEAGWYDDGSSRLRWWDGQQWTEHFAPEGTAAESTDSAAATDNTAFDATTPEVAPSKVFSTEASTPEATSPEATAPEAAAPEFSAPDAADPYAVIAPSIDPVQPIEPIQPIPAAGADTFAVAPPAMPAYVAPGFVDSTAPATSAMPMTPGFPAAGTGYPGAAQSGAAPSYAAPSYQAAGGYAAPAYAAAAPATPKKANVVGIIGLVAAGLGLILSCIPFPVAIFGWVLLFGGFVTSIISLFLKAAKWPGITGLIVSVIGSGVAAIMGFVFFFIGISEASETYSDDWSTAEESTDESTDDATDGGSDAPNDNSSAPVSAGMGETLTIDHYGSEAEVTVLSASWGAQRPNANDTMPSTAGGFLVVDFTWTTTSGTTFASPLSFELLDASGESLSYDIFSTDQFASAEIPAGETLSGQVIFDAAQADSYQLIVLDGMLDEAAIVDITPTQR